MSSRNYKAMGETKFAGVVQDFDQLDAEDKIRVTQIAKDRGVSIPASSLTGSTPPPSQAPTTPGGLSAKNLAMNAEAPKGSPEHVFNGTTLNGVGLPEYVMEAKLDGIRILAHVDGEEVRFYTRTATDKTGFLPYIEAALLDTFPSGTWLDGEVVVFNEDGSQNWGGAQSILGSNKARASALSYAASYVIFDTLTYNGLDIRSLSLMERRRVLDEHLSKPWVDQGRTLLVPSEQEQPSQERYEELLKLGYEGAMLKRKDGKYHSGKRGYGWTKIKNTDTQDVIVTGYEPGKDSFQGMIGAIQFGQYKDGKLTYRGKCSGMDMKTRKDITANQDAYLGRVFEVSYMGIMPSGVLRHPQYKKFRDDKPAEDCVWQ